jgi:hypothetical protein
MGVSADDGPFGGQRWDRIARQFTGHILGRSILELSEDTAMKYHNNNTDPECLTYSHETQASRLGAAPLNRRAFVAAAAATAAAFPTLVRGEEQSSRTPPAGFRSLFDGQSLKGWHTASRLPTPYWPGSDKPIIDPKSADYRKAASSQGKWSVIDGAIIAAQDPHDARLGGYLVTDETFGDFELKLDARPDWPVDTGVLLRTPIGGVPGFQVLVDHRPSGGIGGYYGNGLSHFHALPYTFNVRKQNGKPVALVVEDAAKSLEPATEEKRKLLKWYAPAEAFLTAWKFNDWNTFNIRCEGKYPLITTWINEVKITEFDTAALVWKHYDKEAVAKLLGRRGHISLELHDSDSSRDPLADERWGPGAVCRWRNIFIREL